MHFHFSTVVWGPWHTGVFLEVNLPSLLASENLAAFAAHHRVTYRIFTSRRDVSSIMASPAFQRARDLVPFELIEYPVEDTDDPIGMHHLLWRRSIKEAQQAGAMILFVPPDVAWSNGSFRHLSEVALQGKKAIFITYVRVVSETCIPELRRRHLSQDGTVLEASPRRLVELALQYIHPLALTCMRDSPNFPIHPELILWSVPGEGLLMRVLVREMFAYDPSLFDLNQQALLAHAPDPDDVHYVTDSDDVFALSFAPIAKDIEWYERPQRLDAPKIGSWWLTYDSPANDLVAREYFYIHSATRTPQKWRRPELESDALMRRIKGTREILRLLSAMGQKELLYARQVLAFALAETKLASMIGRIGPITLLIPQDDAMRHWLTGAGEEMLNLRSSRQLVDLILDHVVVGRVPLEVGKNVVLKTVRDGERSLTWRNNTPLVDDAVLQPPALPVAHDWSYVTDVWALTTDQVLAPSRGALRRKCSRVRRKCSRSVIADRRNF